MLLSCSRLWLCSIPPEQHDGCHAVWVTHVHGQFPPAAVCYPAQFFCPNQQLLNMWTLLFSQSHFLLRLVFFSSLRLQRSSCPRTMMPRPTCGALEPSSISVWSANLHFRLVHCSLIAVCLHVWFSTCNFFIYFQANSPQDLRLFYEKNKNLQPMYVSSFAWIMFHFKLWSSIKHLV